MRRVIPFIASNYQNDRIWLRRLKLVERHYQILVAVDDSSSMKENKCKQVKLLFSVEYYYVMFNCYCLLL